MPAMRELLHQALQGGPAGVVLVLVCFATWCVATLRSLTLLTLGRGDGLDARTRAALAERHGAPLHALATVATLLGLLGTVAGMVETFDAMQTSTFHVGAERSMAGGISVALTSTQLGLVVGIPGLVAARLLDRLARRRLDAGVRSSGEVDGSQGVAASEVSA